MFQDANAYWSSIVTPSICKERKAHEEQKLATGIDQDHEILDVYGNVQVSSKLVFIKF